MVGTTITVTDIEANKKMLVIERVGGEAVRINELNMAFEGCTFVVDNDVMTATVGASVIKITAYTAQGGGVFSFNLQGFHTNPDYYEAGEWIRSNWFKIPLPADTGGFCISLDGMQFLTKRKPPLRFVGVDDSTKLEDRYLSAEEFEVTIFLCENKKSGSDFSSKLRQECKSVTVNHREPITFIVLSVEDGINKHGHLILNQPLPSQYTIETSDPRLLGLFQNVKLIK